MPSRYTSAALDRLIFALTEIRDSAIALERSFAAELTDVDPAYQASARNLLHYLALRQHDVRELQHDLTSFGLSSLAGCEAHTLATLDAVLAALHRLGHRSMERPPGYPSMIGNRAGAALLAAHTEMLLGPPPRDRTVRIMVTMPGEAADDGNLVAELLGAGMNVMRINCAHDDAAAWLRMVANLRRAQQRLDLPCRVYADLAGPKLRTGTLPADCSLHKIRVRYDARGQLLAPARVLLCPAGTTPAGIMADAVLPLDPRLITAARVGDSVEIADCRGRHRRLRILATPQDTLLTELERNLWLEDGAKAKLVHKGKIVAKGRVGPLPRIALPVTVKVGDTLILCRDLMPGQDARRAEDGSLLRPARLPCTLAEAFADVGPAERIWFDDGKIGGVVTRNGGDEIDVRITHADPGGSRLAGDKGINLPDTRMSLPGLTAKDFDDLSFAVEAADVVGLSFVRRTEDVLALQEHVQRLGAPNLGMVLKIENRQAFENLPRLLMASLRSPPVGVMVARGDLAVEVGFERLAEVQEEILWLCEAAHVPVIWATQVLESLAKRGAPSRAEVTDASKAGRAECVMLNKGPHAVEAVRFLSDVLARMQAHQSKNRGLLRKLEVSRVS